MHKNFSLTVLAAAVSMVLANAANAADPAVPVLTVPAKAPAAAAATPSKAPGTIAAPAPPSLSYLQPAVPALQAAPVAAPVAKAAPVVAPAAPVQAAAKPAAASQEVCTGSAAASACSAPAVKKIVHRAPRPRAQVAVPAEKPAKIGDGFDFRFNGDLWTALQMLSIKHGPLSVSSQGTPTSIPVQLDLRNVALIDALAALGEQGGTAADIIYNRAAGTARLAYKGGVALQVPVEPRVLGGARAPAAAPVQASVAVSPIDEAKSWQQGGVARPVMGQDGLLLYPFGQSQPTLTCMPLRACDLQLQPGELINNVILGDTVRWIPAPAMTGSGTQATPHVIIKPTEIGITTNLIVTTNRRTYMLTLKASEGQYVSRIGYYYPQDMVQDWNGQAEAERRKVEDDASRKVADLPISNIGQLNLDSYKIKGDSSLPWYPVRVFDEGTHVWIQMPPSMKASDAPALVLIGSNGASELVNYRVKEADQGGAKVTYYIVDKLFTKAALIIGVGNAQQKVEIVKAGSSSWFN